MKKRLLSMLMAVLMIVSLVPGMALADTEYVIDIKADAAAKQPGIQVTANANGGYDVTIKEFGTLAECATCKHTNLKTVELIKATCEAKGLTVTYCADCGTQTDEMKALTVMPDALGHDCTFTVVVKPTCNKNGWGYAQCKVCGEPFAIHGDTAARDVGKYIAQGKTETDTDYKARVAEAVKLFTTDNKHDYQYVTADVVKKDNEGNDYVYAHAEKAASHVATIHKSPFTYQWADNGAYIYESVVNVNTDLVAKKLVVKVDGSGYTKADKVCTKCGVLEEPAVTASDNLNVLHANSMKLIEEGTDAKYFPKDGSYVDGKTDRWYCSECKAYFGGETISALKAFNVTAPVDYKAGDTKLYENETVYLLNGTTVTEATADQVKAVKPATCTDKGYTGDTITYTQLNAADKDGNVNYGWVLTAKGVETDALGHHFVAKADEPATCTKGGVHYVGVYVCDNVVGKDDNGKDVLCNTEKTDVINYTTPIDSAHTPTVVVLVEATCQHKGLSVLQCSVCKEYLVAHEYNHVTTYQTADNGEIPAYTVEKAKHTAAAELKDAKEATCTEVGYTGDKVCKWCGIVLEKGKEIPMKEHTPEEVAAVAATCTETGLTAGSKCSVCGEVLTAQEVVPALGHDYKDGKCTRCGAADPDYVAPVVNPFKDVEKTSPYYDAIIWAAKEEITTGKTADTFGINEGCTRAQIVTFLYRAAGSPEVKADTVNPFTDVSKDSVYYNAILWAVENGITKGTTETTFDPNAVCTRGQIVTFLFRASGDEKVATGTNFADVASGSYCADAVAWAVANKVANGFSDGTFRPEATCTRGQAVTFIYRALAE